MIKNYFFALLITFAVAFLSYSVSYSVYKGDEKMDIQVTSPAFDRGEMIPAVYTCQGDNISPQLNWENLPESTESVALIADDPDAPIKTWVHWVIFNIPANEGGLPKNIPTSENLKNGAVQGTNSSKKTGYIGPCPPSGTHRYFFKVYALDKMLDLKPEITKKELLKAMKGHILAEGELMGKYKKK